MVEIKGPAGGVRRSLSSRDLEDLHGHLVYGGLLFTRADEGVKKVPSSDGMDKVPSGSALAKTPSTPSPRHSMQLTSEDLEDLHPHLIYGALLSSLRAVAYSLVDVAPALLSFRVAAAAVLTAALVTALCSVVQLHVLGRVVAVVLVVTEGVFFICMHCIRRQLQLTRPVEDRLAAPGGPEDCFRRTLESIDECAAWRNREGYVNRSPEEWLSGWFLGAPFEKIRRGNVVELFAWAFFTRKPSELDDAQDQLLMKMVSEVCAKYSWQLPEGYDTDLRPIRINFDRMDVWSHPLCYYLGIGLLHWLARQTFRLLGFEALGGQPGSLSYFHFKASASVAESEPRDTKEADPPIVVLHGLGVGLSPYLRMVRRLRHGGSREVFVIELPEVSQSGTRQVWGPTDFPQAVQAMLRRHGHASACFLAHSYGTFALSWVQRAQPGLVHQAVMIDPVNFMLSQPDVAFNFLYRRPVNLFSMAVANFVRWELFSANVLMRNFYWYHNVLWLDEIPSRCVVVLSGNDDIINANAVRQHLECLRTRRPEACRHLKVLWYKRFFHGEIMLSKAAQVEIIDAMRQNCSL